MIDHIDYPCGCEWNEGILFPCAKHMQNDKGPQGPRFPVKTCPGCESDDPGKDGPALGGADCFDAFHAETGT